MLDVTTQPTSKGTYGGKENGYYDVGKLRRQYLDYLSVKQPEISEAQQSRHYYHADQWTAAEIAVLKKRRQPVTTNNRIARKINGVIGLLERLKQDPKAYPRTPKHEADADLATAVLRYTFDEQRWDVKATEAGRDGAIEGIGGIQLDLEQGDLGDNEISVTIVPPDTFFYDPRSFQPDFSDARFMGIAKWMDVESAKELFPDKADDLDGMVDAGGAEFNHDADRERKWIDSDQKRLRVIDHWYLCEGEWKWCIYVATLKLMEGESFLHDEKGKTICRYIMFSANVDHDGDRYGFVRNLKSNQDGLNQRTSKILQIANSRRIIADKDAVDDVERARIEYARPDGWVEKNPGLEIKPETRAEDLQAHLALLQEDKNEIENFGPNPALIGQGVENKSGRAIALLQQAGIAELGPFISAYKGWKLRVYRAVFNAIREHWQAERWIRVTDDDNAMQFVAVNQMQVDPMAGPQMVNHMASLDVDIILDEGPDTVNMMADTYEALLAMISAGSQVPPDVLLELAPGIDSATKKRLIERIKAAAQPDPGAEKAKQIALASEASKVAKTQAETDKIKGDTKHAMAQSLNTMAQALNSFSEVGQPPMQQVS